MASYKVGDKVEIYIHNKKVKQVTILRIAPGLWGHRYLFRGEFDGCEMVQWYSEKHILGKIENTSA